MTFSRTKATAAASEKARKSGRTSVSEQRVIDLEIMVSHQEQTLETLQQLVYEQQKALEKLASRVDRLVKKYDDQVEIGPADDKPPHY